MKRLESALISGNYLFRLVSEGDNLELLSDEYENPYDVAGVRKSGQPDMVLSSTDLDTLDIMVSGSEYYLGKSDNPNTRGCIGILSNENWTCFYIKIDPKLAFHVQANNANINFSDYEHKGDNRTIDDLMEEMTKSKLAFDSQLSSMMEEIDAINIAIEKMDKISDSQ